MSKKRTSTESNRNDDEPPTKEDGSEAVLFREEEESSKRAKFDSILDTTLEDLPIELLESIFVEVIVMEVMGMKLGKNVWKEKADLVMSRLGAVCWQWNNALSTNYFRKVVYRILDATAEKTFRLEVLHETPIQAAISHNMTTMKDEIFMLYRQTDKDYAINVYDCNNMAKVKDVIPLPGRDPVCMTACNVSNCVYVGLRNKNCLCPSVLRISKDGEHQFSESPFIHDRSLSISTMCLSTNGHLAILSLQAGRTPAAVVRIYDASGSFQHEIVLSPEIDAFSYENVIQRANGNLILAYVKCGSSRMNLLEIDNMCGSVVRHYQSTLSRESFVSFADVEGRIMITQKYNGIELLDFEFNLLCIYSAQQDKDMSLYLNHLHFDRERNEILRIHCDQLNTKTCVLTAFSFTEEESTIAGKGASNDEDNFIEQL